MKKIKWKLNTLTIIFDILSFAFGFLGIVLGLYSLLTLDPSWDDPELSYKFTISAIVFDILSCLLALFAFTFGYQYFVRKKPKLLNFRDILKLEVSTIALDFTSFFFGLVGVIFEAISLLALLPSWNNDLLSYQVTVAAIVFDIISAGLVICALYLVLKATKKLKLVSKGC